MDASAILEIVDDVKMFQDTFLKKTKYFIMSDSRSKYLKLTKQQYDFYEKLIPYLRKELTLAEVIEAFCRDYVIVEEQRNSITNSITNAIGVLEKHCLFAGVDSNYIPKVEFELSGKKVFEIKLNKSGKKKEMFMNITLKTIMLVSFIVLFFSVLLIITRTNFAFSNFWMAQNFSIKSLKVFDIVWVILGFIVSILFHELGHMLTANYFGISVKSLTLFLHMGISPVFYVRYKNFYASPSKNKLKVMLAGPYFNLTLASFLWIFINIRPNWICSLIMIVNFWLFFENLIPSGVSDGYNILTTIFGIEGLRWNMLIQTGKLFQDKKVEKNKKLYIVYFGVSYGMTYYGVYFLIRYIMNLLNLSMYSNYVKFIVSIILGVVVIFYALKFIKNLKRIGK